MYEFARTKPMPPDSDPALQYGKATVVPTVSSVTNGSNGIEGTIMYAGFCQAVSTAGGIIDP